MKLETVQIKRYRSVEEVELADCGRFNVLIGKNNAGKSTILSAINAFFVCMRSQTPVITNPHRIGRAVDFFKGDTRSPIEITLSFAMSLSERDALIQDIVAEASQMRHAVEGLDPSLRLSATLRVTARELTFAYVSRLSLIPIVKPGAVSPVHERVILDLSREAAGEIAARSIRTNAAKNLVHNLKNVVVNVSEDDWKRIQRDENIITHIVTFREPLTPSIRSDPETWRIIRKYVMESKTLPEFFRAIQSVAEAEAANIEKVNSEPLPSKVDTFAGHQATIPQYATNILRKIGSMKVHYLTERRKQIGKEEAERLLALKVRRGGPNVLRNIQETISALLGVKIDAFEADDPTRRGERNAELDVDDFLVEVNGSGIREALRLVLDVEFEHPEIVLTEEPEMHLHPALETTMMRYLKRISAECQVFITTHSTNFLDTADMKNVYLVSKLQSTRVQMLDFEEAESQIPKELGIRLSSLFMFDRLVMVEAPSDENIIREWSSKLGVNLSQANVGFVTMSGARDLHYFAAETILSFLSKRQVKLWFLIDRDERDSADVTRLETTLGERAVIKVLNRREMENYLISPRALVEFIRLKKELAGAAKEDAKVPTEEEITAAIDQAADQLKGFALHKRVAKELCKPIYPKLPPVPVGAEGQSVITVVTAELDKHINELQVLKEKAAEALRRQAEALDARWGGNKLNVVPGDMLLNQVCEKYGVRFKKERDGVRLAALMLESEIDDEVKRFIREIGT
jgi:putative ATP-dependent endonuclease of OLD family